MKDMSTGFACWWHCALDYSGVSFSFLAIDSLLVYRNLLLVCQQLLVVRQKLLLVCHRKASSQLQFASSQNGFQINEIRMLNRFSHISFSMVEPRDPSLLFVANTTRLSQPSFPSWQEISPQKNPLIILSTFTTNLIPVEVHDNRT
jgi:hypothetical protein